MVMVTSLFQINNDMKPIKRFIKNWSTEYTVISCSLFGLLLWFVLLVFVGRLIYNFVK